MRKAKGFEGFTSLFVITSVLTKAQLLRAAYSSLFSVMGLPIAQSPTKFIHSHLRQVLLLFQEWEFKPLPGGRNFMLKILSYMCCAVFWPYLTEHKVAEGAKEESVSGRSKQGGPILLWNEPTFLPSHPSWCCSIHFFCMFTVPLITLSTVSCL